MGSDLYLLLIRRVGFGNYGYGIGPGRVGYFGHECYSNVEVQIICAKCHPCITKRKVVSLICSTGEKDKRLSRRLYSTINTVCYRVLSCCEPLHSYSKGSLVLGLIE